jgi:hypothetical protein
MGVVITYIVFLCTTVNGPLVTSITGKGQEGVGAADRVRAAALALPPSPAGNAKDVVQTILGALLFHDFTPTVQNVTGILVSFTGTGA